MEPTEFEIDLNHCQVYLDEFKARSKLYSRPGQAEQARAKFVEQWPNILAAQAWSVEWAERDTEAGRCCINFGLQVHEGLLRAVAGSRTSRGWVEGLGAGSPQPIRFGCTLPTAPRAGRPLE